MSKKKWTEKLKTYFCKLVKSGWSINQIANHFKIAPSTVLYKKSQYLGKGVTVKLLELDDDFWKQYQYMCDVANKKEDYNSNYDTGNRLRKYLMSIKVFE